MKNSMIALFGEAEKGEFNTPYLCRNLPQLVDSLGQPPPKTQGVYYAVQALLFNYHLIFFRVQEEGFSFSDYMHGLHLLESEPSIFPVTAICTPGVGDKELLEAIIPLCKAHHQILITNESDLYDYLTSGQAA